MGLLPSGVYGDKGIPTLLGADGFGTGYNNDHPVGIQATLGAAHLIGSPTDTSNLTVTFGPLKIVPTAGSKYANFVADYGMPSLAGTAWGYGVGNPSANTDPTKLFVTCTTCHNQHVMNVYQALPGYTGKPGIAGSNTGSYKTYFFINAPYNIDNFNQGGNTFTNQAPSATQFCRQCHFSEANEYFGLNLPTKF
jgi:cytochrome c553